VVTAIKGALKHQDENPKPSTTRHPDVLKTTSTPPSRSSNLRIKKQFTDWIKSEGTAHAYFDWQAGARLDLDSGPTRAWATLGVQGLAPYFFNFAPTFYVRDGGRVAGIARIMGVIPGV
jgi:hypothetical protein